MLLGIALFLAANPLEAGPPDPSAIVRPCSPLSAEQFGGAVDSIMSDPDRVRAMNPAGDLLWAWRNRCPISDRRSREAIARSAARLLERGELRTNAAWILYQLGDDAQVVRSKIHSALQNQEWLIAETYRLQGYMIGAAPSTRDSLKCLDLTLRGWDPSDELCHHLRSFNEWQLKPKSELD